MLNSKKKHIIWIDYAKVFGIFLVVYGHGNFCGDLFNYIYSFHMPMFFIICGILYKPVSLVQTLKKGWISLMRPYIILNIICWTPFLIVKFLDDSLTMQYVFSKLGGVLFGLGYEKNGFSPISSPCWFIYTLFLMKVILAVIPNHRSGTLWCVIGVSMLLTYCFQIANIDTLIPVDSALLALPFMCCGYMYKEFITLKMFKTIPKVLLLLAFLFFCYSVDYNGMVGINRCFIGHSLILFYLNATIASVIFFSLCNAFSSMLFRLKYSIGIDLTGGVKIIASTTIIYIVFNLLIIDFTKIFLHYIFPMIDMEGGLIGLSIALIVFFEHIPLCLLCLRYFPILVGNRKQIREKKSTCFN